MPRHTIMLILAAIATIACVALCVTGTAQDTKLSPDLKPFLDSYFAVWSAGDMAAYRSHFHPRARIALLRAGDVYQLWDRDTFVEMQSELVSGARLHMVERMTSFSALEDKYAASVAAKWELTKGDESSVGVDRFTLIRDENGKWQIMFLLFYETGR